MPKKPLKESDLTILRKGLGLSQSDFARRLGVSASMIKKLEEGKRAMSQDLQGRIFAETGVLFTNGCVSAESFTYTKEDYAAWIKETQLNGKAAAALARIVSKHVQLMLVSAARPGVQKSYQVFTALLQSIEKTKKEFQLEKHIEAELRDAYSTETKVYTVRELRDNDLLASMVHFKDNPSLKDDDTRTLTKTTGWLPSKELFNIWWQHRAFFREIEAQGDTLSDETKAKVAQIESEGDSEITAFLKRNGWD